MIMFNNLIPSKDTAKDLFPAFSRVMTSGRYIGGEEVELFEREFANYVGSAHCIAVGNGFDALQIALKAVGIGPGKTVAVPTNTCIPTWAAVHNVGATIVPVEPADEYLITAKYIPCDAEDAIVPVHLLDAIIPVHLYGNPISKNEIDKMILSGAVVIEDACQAHGSYADGHHAGTMGHMGCFSFYPTKNRMLRGWGCHRYK